MTEQLEEALKIALQGINELKWEMTIASDKDLKVNSFDIQCKLIELHGKIFNMAYLNVKDGKWLGVEDHD